MPVSLAAKEMWDEIDEIEARRDRIVLGLRKNRVKNHVRYRHHLDEPSLACYEDKSNEGLIAPRRTESGWI
jgi:hypothetical protein